MGDADLQDKCLDNSMRGMNIKKKNPDTGTTSSLLMENKEVRAQSSGRMLAWHV